MPSLLLWGLRGSLRQQEVCVDGRLVRKAREEILPHV